jgi:hypothetical protein
LFLYVKTKEDLLVLVFKHEIEPVIHGSFDDVPDADLLTQLLHVLNPVIEHHSHNLTLSKPFLKDLNWVNEPVASDVTVFLGRWLARLADLVDKAKARGEVRPEIDTILVVRCSNQLFFGLLRRWVGGWITRQELEGLLPQALGLLLTGLGPAAVQAPVATARTTAKTKAKTMAKPAPKAASKAAPKPAPKTKPSARAAKTRG